MEWVSDRIDNRNMNCSWSIAWLSRFRSVPGSGQLRCEQWFPAAQGCAKTYTIRARKSRSPAVSVWLRPIIRLLGLHGV